MAFDVQGILGEMGAEVGERYVHQELSRLLREEIAKGNSTKNIVARAIIRLRSNEYLLKVHALLGPRALGLTLVGCGTLLAKLLQHIDFDGLLPDDQGNIMKQVRYVLKHAAPALIVGAAEGAADTWEQKVHETVNSVITDPAETPTTVVHKPGAIDSAYDVESTNGVDYWVKYGLLFPEWGEDGKLQYDTDGAVILAGVNGRKFTHDWRAAHDEHWEEVPVEPLPNDQQGGRGRNQNQNNNQPRTRRVLVPRKIHKGTLVPLAIAVTRIASVYPMDPELLALAKAALVLKDPLAPKKVEVSEKGLLLMKLLTQKVATRTPLEQKLIIDLANDIAQSPEKINHLGDMFVTDANQANGLSDDEYAAIQTHLQMWLGSTLTIENRMRLAFEHAKNAFDNAQDPVTGTALATGVRVEKAVGVFAQTIGKYALASFIGFTALFAMFLGLVLFGAFAVSLHHPLTFSNIDIAYGGLPLLCLALAWNFSGWTRFLFVVFGITTGIPAAILITADVMERLLPHEFAVALVAGGGILACIELFSFTAIQGLLSIVTRFFPNVHKDWLVNKGRILIMFLFIHVGIFSVLLSLKTPLIFRLLICVPTFFALASQMGLSGYEFGEEARQRARKTTRLFGALSTIVFVAIIGALAAHWLGKSFSDVVGWIMGSRIVQSILIFSGAGFLLWKAVRRMEEVSRETSVETGMPKSIDYRRNWWLRSVALILVLGLASWPWIESDINAHYAAEAPASLPAKLINQMTAPAPQPTVQPPAPSAPVSAQVIAPVPVSGTRATQPRRRSQKISASECAGYSYEWRRDLECE